MAIIRSIAGLFEKTQARTMNAIKRWTTTTVKATAVTFGLSWLALILVQFVAVNMEGEKMRKPDYSGVITPKSEAERMERAQVARSPKRKMSKDVSRKPGPSLDRPPASSERAVSSKWMGWKLRGFVQ
jgi:hypothetical protein